MIWRNFFQWERNYHFSTLCTMHYTTLWKISKITPMLCSNYSSNHCSEKVPETSSSSSSKKKKNKRGGGFSSLCYLWIITYSMKTVHYILDLTIGLDALIHALHFQQRNHVWYVANEYWGTYICSRNIFNIFPKEYYT